MTRAGLVGLVMAMTGTAWADGGLPPGEALDRGEGGAVLLDLDRPDLFPGGLEIDGDPIDTLAIDANGVLTLGVAAPAGAPRPLAELGGVMIIAPFWAALDATGCRRDGADNTIRLEHAPGTLTVHWWQVVPDGCPDDVDPVTFSATVSTRETGGLRVAFHYADGGTTGVYAPRAGVVLLEAFELFPDGGPETPPDRAKALIDGGSDGERGHWVIEVGADGTVRNDDDRDGVRNGVDNCRREPNPQQLNLDGDSQGDVCDGDDDDDQVFEVNGDNCPRVANSDQSDLDEDGLGDACDPDVDGDGVDDRRDVCRWEFDPLQLDSDGDEMGDRCDVDIDGDDAAAGVLGLPDGCPYIADPDRADRDRDGLGDACDLAPERPCKGLGCVLQLDSDGDRVGDIIDVCPTRWDPHQKDQDFDGLGDLCDLWPRSPIGRLSTEAGTIWYEGI